MLTLIFYIFVNGPGLENWQHYSIFVVKYSMVYFLTSCLRNRLVVQSERITGKINI